jgi:FO synthase
MDLNSAMKQQERVLRVVTRPEQVPDHNEALQLANETDTKMLADIAATLRDAGHRNLVTYSRKVFIPLTHLCRDVCHYCTFAQTPKHLSAPYMTIEQILDVAHRGAAFGCKEALFTLGEKPELRYRAARHALDEMGYSSTIEYLREAARLVYEETGLLPHLNPGTMSTDEIEMLRPVAPSMGIMLETSSQRLSGKGMPHYGSPDKHPGARLTTIEGAGKARIPLTGICRKSSFKIFAPSPTPRCPHHRNRIWTTCSGQSRLHASCSGRR